MVDRGSERQQDEPVIGGKAFPREIRLSRQMHWRRVAASGKGPIPGYKYGRRNRVEEGRGHGPRLSKKFPDARIPWISLPKWRGRFNVSHGSWLLV